MPERVRSGASLNADDPTTYYGGGAKGSTDYPTLARERGEEPHPWLTKGGDNVDVLPETQKLANRNNESASSFQQRDNAVSRGFVAGGPGFEPRLTESEVLKGHNMQVPLDITFRNSEPSEAIRSEVEKQAKRLEKFHDRITSCHVTVIAPTMKRRHGDLFKIDIRVAMPQHTDVLVSKAHGDAPEHEHVMVAIKDAFAAAQRQIEDAAREKRG